MDGGAPVENRIHTRINRLVVSNSLLVFIVSLLELINEDA
jgi:hypothetical protein